MAAIADASDGFPVSIDDAYCLAIFGCKRDKLPRIMRRTVCVSAGRRGGKSWILGAAKAVHLAWTVAVPKLAPGEKARVVLLAPDKDLAEQDLDYVRGFVDSSPVLRAHKVPNQRGKDPATFVRLRRPDGVVVDIRIAAASRGGKSVRGRNLLGVILDEASFFYADNGYTVTDKEIYRAALPAIVPGGQVWILSTPWIEGVGLLEERIREETAADGTRRHEKSLVIARVGTRMLNPTWDPDGTIEADLMSDPENHAREILAIPMSAGTTSFFDPVAVARAFDLPAWGGRKLGSGVGGDLALAGDCSAMAVADRYDGDNFDARGFREHRPKKGEPLKLSEVCADFSSAIKAHGADEIALDAHEREAAREYFDAEGIRIVACDADVKVPSYLATRKVLHEGRLRIVSGDGVSPARIREQLLSIVSKPVEGGGIRISSPRRRSGAAAVGAGHGDIVSALVLALWRAGAGKPANRRERGGLLECGSSRYDGRGRGRVRVDRMSDSEVGALETAVIH